MILPYHILAPMTRRVMAVCAVAAALLCMTGATHSAERTTTPTILIIDNSNPDSPLSRDLRTQIHSTLDTEIPAGYTLYTEFLDARHFNARDYDLALQTYIKEKYRNHGLSAIVTIGWAAFDFAVRLRSELRPDLPIVFVTFDEARVGQTSPSNSTGIISPRRFEDLVKVARILAPQTARVAVVGTPIQNQPYRRQYLRELSELARSTEVLDLTTLPFSEVTAKLAKLPDDAVIISIPLYEDASGHIHQAVETMRKLVAVADRPIVTDVEYLLGAGAAGAVVLSAANLGSDVGKLVGRILNGESASAIPVEVREHTEAVFNAHALQTWDIREETLPPASKVLFRELTVWERYRWQILTALAVLLVQSVIITGLMIERHRRRVAERDSHQRLLEVTKMDRALTAGAMSSSIAHELNQPLTAIMNNAEAAAMLLKANSLDREELRAIVADIRRDDERAANIIKHLRLLLRQSELKPEDLALNEVLADSIALIEGPAHKCGVTVQAEIPSVPIHVRADYVHVQQVILNLALNAIEAMRDLPSGQRLLKIRLRTKDDSKAIVSISDSGPGVPSEKMATIFNPFVTTKAEGTGLGLSIAKTIIATYGGRIWAENTAGGGAAFHFSLKLVPATDIRAQVA